MTMKIGWSSVDEDNKRCWKMMMWKTRQWRWWWWGRFSTRNEYDYGDDGISKTKDVDDGNTRSKHGDDSNSRSKGDDEDKWCFQLEGIQVVTNTPTANLNGARMMGLQTMGYELGTGSDEVRNSRRCEWWDYELRKLGLTGEHEDKYEDQWDHMAWNKKTRLMCEWLVLNPVRGIKEVISIYSGLYM